MPYRSWFTASVPNLAQLCRVPPFLLKFAFCLCGLFEVIAIPVKNIVQTDKAPGAIGPYSQAIKAGGLVFVSGQIPIDPASGQFVAGGISEQTEQVMKNLAAVLESAGSGLDQVVKSTVFLADMNEFAAMNQVYGQYFSHEPPARATVEVSRLPRDARVEIDVIALI